MMKSASCGPCTSSRETTRKNVGFLPESVSAGLVADPVMNARPARPISGPTAWTSWLPAGPTTPTIFEFEVNCCVTVVACAGFSWVSPWTRVMLVPLALLSSAMASLAKASCSSPSTATWPVIGASMPIDAAQVFELPPLLAAAVELPLLAEVVLLLLLLPQPAATKAVRAMAARLMRTFIDARTPPVDGSLNHDYDIGLCGRHRRRPGVCRSAVRVIRGRRRTGRPKHGDETHDGLAGVLQAMHGPSRQLEARAGGDRSVAAAGVQCALSLNHKDDFVVHVEMLRRALGRDVADEVSR